MKKVLAAQDTFHSLRKLAEEDMETFRRIPIQRANRIHHDLQEAKERWRELQKVLYKVGSEGAYRLDFPPFPLAMLFLKIKDFDMAALYFNGRPTPEGIARGTRNPLEEDFLVHAAPALTGYERYLFFLCYAREVEAYNLKADPLLSQEFLEAVAINNQYRVSLGVSPYQIHSALNRAIREHLETMEGFTHTGWAPELHTPTHRAIRAGYGARKVGENLGMFDIIKGMENWKWDGGHHRNLLNPGYVHIGIGQVNACGMDVAQGEKPALPVLHCIRY
jgi:uncharacterized protein YkwD